MVGGLGTPQASSTAPAAVAPANRINWRREIFREVDNFFLLVVYLKIDGWVVLWRMSIDCQDLIVSSLTQ